jgi:hypothetical protein
VESSNILQLNFNKDNDPDGSKLREFLTDQFTYERKRAGRYFCVHLLAILGAVIWVDALWPDLLPPDARVFSLALWGGMSILTVRFVVEEYLSHRRLRRYRTEGPGVVPSHIQPF